MKQGVQERQRKLSLEGNSINATGKCVRLLKRLIPAKFLKAKVQPSGHMQRQRRGDAETGKNSRARVHEAIQDRFPGPSTMRAQLHNHPMPPATYPRKSDNMAETNWSKWYSGSSWSNSAGPGSDELASNWPKMRRRVPLPGTFVVKEPAIIKITENPPKLPPRPPHKIHPHVPSAAIAPSTLLNNSSRPTLQKLFVPAGQPSVPIF